MIEDNRWPNDPDNSTGSSSTDASRGARHVLALYATAILMLVAWRLYRAWTEPLSRRDHLLHGLLLSLVAVLPLVSRRGRDSWVVTWSRSPIRRRLAALLPLVVLALFGWSQLISARQREAERQLALKSEYWRQEVERQRNRVELAEQRWREAAEKGKKASEALQKTWTEVKTADGQPHHHADSAAMQRWKEAFAEVTRTMNDSIEERQRLFELERRKPHR
jgi:hypothetical protein